MFKIKKKIEKPKPPILYNVIEDYSEFDAPGNVTVCAMTLPENLPGHAKILSESYEVPLEQMMQLLTEGGVYVYPQVGGVLTRGLFACRVDASGEIPKQTWVLDLMQFAEAEQLARARALTLMEAATEVFYRTLPEELTTKLAKKSGTRLPDAGPCRRERRRHQVYRLPQGLVSALQTALHHARRTSRRNGRIGRVRSITPDYGGAGEETGRGGRDDGGGRRRSPGLPDCKRPAGRGALQCQELRQGEGVGRR